MSKVSLILKWITIFAAIVTLLAYLSPYLVYDKLFLVSVSGLVYPWLLLLNLLLLLWWGIAKNSRFLLPLFCILLGWNHLRSFVNWQSPTEATTEITNLDVLTFNCHSFRDVEAKKKAFIDREALKKLTNTYPIDILCLQEFPTNKDWAQKFKNDILSLTNLSYYYLEEGYGLAIFSAYPIRNKDITLFSNRHNGFQFVDIEVDKELVRIYNFHLQSNRVSGPAKELEENWNIFSRKTWSGVKKLIDRYTEEGVKRADQAKRVNAHAHKSALPFLLCGDLNDVSPSGAYRFLSTKVQDGFKKKGRGIAATYAGSIPGLRIDYIFIDQQGRFLDYQKKPIPFSDHHLVYAKVVWGERFEL